MARISVIVPVYNVEPYLHRCVDSILRQTIWDFEVILVDDGSPDRCGEICEEYARRDGRVHVIHKENGGLSDARNAAIDWVFANSDSQWLTFIDSDDWVHPLFLELLLDAAAKENTAVSICGFAETAGEEPAVPPEIPEPEAWIPADFYRQRFVNATIACAKLYRRSCFETIRYPVGKIHEDEFVTYRILFSQDSLAFIPAPLYAYYINHTGITKKIWTPGHLDAWVAYEEQIAFFLEKGEQALVSFRYRGYLENALVNYRAANESEDAPEIRKARKRIHRKIRELIRRMRKQGCLNYKYDFDIIIAFYPIRTRVYRLLRETAQRLGWKHET